MPSRDSDPGTHSRLFFRPSPPTTVRALHFCREIEGFSSSFPRRLASTRIVRTHAISFFLFSFLFFYPLYVRSWVSP